MSVVLAALTALAVIVIVGAILDACERRRNRSPRCPARSGNSLSGGSTNGPRPGAGCSA